MFETFDQDTINQIAAADSSDEFPPGTEGTLDALLTERIGTLPPADRSATDPAGATDAVGMDDRSG